MKIIITVLIYLFITVNAFSQHRVDTVEVMKIANAYIVLQQFNTSLDSKTIADIINQGKVSSRILKSQGFKQLFFFTITTKAGLDSVLINNCEGRKYEKIINTYTYTYVFGYNTTNNTLYKLSGFEDNDFYALYKSLRDFKSDDLDYSVVKKGKKIEKYFHVEGSGLSYKKKGA